VRKKLISYLLIVSALCLKGQDVHFSQYYFSPLSLNPAFTGHFKGDYRLFGNHRSQWKDINSAYSTFSAGGDFNMYPSNMNFSGGLLFISDRSAKYLSVNKIIPSAAWHVKIGTYKFHAGIQPALVIKSVNFNAFSFPNQLNWDIGGFDKMLPNNESGEVSQISYLDLNAGMGVTKKFGKLETELSVAWFHLNRPNESFFDNSNKLPVRQAYTMMAAYPVAKKIVLRAHTLYGYTTLVSDWVSGVNVEYILSTDPFFTNAVFAGFMWRDGFNRNADAGIITVGMHYSHYTVGLSYDVTFSKLKTSVDNKGGYEIAVIYRGKNTRLTKKIIPCDRY
jgi:type IX secretion system PorP/SprF family membrane protein